MQAIGFRYGEIRMSKYVLSLINDVEICHIGICGMVTVAIIYACGYGA